MSECPFCLARQFKNFGECSVCGADITGFPEFPRVLLRVFDGSRQTGKCARCAEPTRRTIKFKCNSIDEREIVKPKYERIDKFALSMIFGWFSFVLILARSIANSITPSGTTRDQFCVILNVCAECEARLPLTPTEIRDDLHAMEFAVHPDFQKAFDEIN